MDPNTEIIQAPVLPPKINLSDGIFESADRFELAQRIANCLVTSTMVPERYRGKENLGNTVIALDIAARIGLPPLMVMQHLYVVYGTPAWSGQMVAALVNGSGIFTDPVEYEMVSEQGKDEWGCRCRATTKNGKQVFGPWVTIRMAKAEGWYQKNGSKWPTMPEVMLRYRAVSYFGRTVCPHVTIGLRLLEEEQEIGPAMTVEMVPGPTSSANVPSLEPSPAMPAPSAAPVPRRRTKAAAPEPPPTPPTPPEATAVPTVMVPPKDTLQMAEELDSRLAAAGIDVEAFLGWCAASGRGQIYHFDPAGCQTLADLPDKLLADLIGGEIEACIKLLGKK